MNTPKRNQSIYLLTALLLFGFYYFLRDLNGLGLWVDEGWTVRVTGSDSLADVTQWVANDVHPPLYFYLMYGWRQIVGNTVFEFRYLTILTILLSTAVIYRLGKTLYNERIGQFAALFYILHDLVWVLGRETRQYSLLQLLAALTVWQYWRFWQKPTRQRGICFVISGSALLWTNYWGEFVLLAIGLHVILTRRHTMKPYLIALGGIGLFFLPWLPTLYHQLTYEIPHGIGHALPATQTGYLTLIYQLIGVPEILWLLLLGAGVLTIWQTKPSRNWLHSTSVLPALIISLTVGCTILINYEYPILSFRALSIVIPFSLILIAQAVTYLGHNQQFVLLTILIAQNLLTRSAQPPLHLPGSDVSHYVVRHAIHQDPILIESWYDAYTNSYYVEQGDPEQPYLLTEFIRAQDPNAFLDYLTRELSHIDGLWVTKHDDPVYDIRLSLADMGFINTANIIWGPSLDWKIELWRFDRPPQQTLAQYGAELQLGRIQSEERDDELTVNILWSPPVKPTQNYVISVFLLDEIGFLKTQDDSQPMEWTSPTLTWEAENWYFDSHILSLEGLAPENYQLGVKVYYFDENGSIQVVPLTDCIENCEYWVAEQIEIE